MPVPAAATIPNRDLTMRELAIQAATTSKLNSFASAYEPNRLQAARVEASFAKTCSPLTRLANICDTGLVKQLCFIQPNHKVAILSCPFLTQGPDSTELIAGSLGDEMDIICPVTIRMKDVRGEVISVCTSRAAADKLKLATSTTNPLEEEGPPQVEDDLTFAEPAGPDRIKVVIIDPTKQPCFVAIPKVLPLTKGYSIATNPAIAIADHPTLPNSETDGVPNLWYETLRYGVTHLDNYSMHAKDTLFVYNGIDKTEFGQPNRNLASRCTTIVTFLTYEDPVYHEVIQALRNEKELANIAFGTKLIEAEPPKIANQPTTIYHNPAPDAVATQPFGMAALIDGFAKAINESAAKTLTGTERERASEAADVTRFYTILFASGQEVIQEDGTTATIIVPAKINALFLPVLTANKNSKATKAMQEAVEVMAAALGRDNDKFASAANLYPKMFDQPLTAAIRTGQWEYTHTVLNPEGIKTNFGIHHLAPPRTMSATYKIRQQGETKLIQQEQVEEDSSRLSAKATDLYYQGRMGTIAEVNEMIGNFFALMNVIIDYDSVKPPILWQEIAKYDQLLRTQEGRQWSELHRNIKEVLFNVVQDIQSTIAGFVSEARKQGYKNLLATGTAISSLIFTDPQLQAHELRRNFQGTILTMSAGSYKESTLLFRAFYPDIEKRKRDSNDANGQGTPPTSRQRQSNPERPSSHHQGTHVTPNGSPAPVSGVQPIPGKTVLQYETTPLPYRLPHPGAIFPHPTKPNNLTILCCRSGYVGRTCQHPACAFYHFPAQLSTVSRELKDKLKMWVTNTALVKWHGDAVQWANPGNVNPSTGSTRGNSNASQST